MGAVPIEVTNRQTVAILDFGSQYTKVIARRVRDHHVYSEILPSCTTAETLADSRIAAIILSGGPASVIGEKAPQLDARVLELNKPILGICYGLQTLLHLLRETDWIYQEILKETGEYQRIWQAFAVLVPVKTVGVMGDQRTYEHLLALRAVTSADGMTADWYRMPSEFLSLCANRLINEVRGINRVVYDVSSKPPSTIEWE